MSLQAEMTDVVDPATSTGMVPGDFSMTDNMALVAAGDPAAHVVRGVANHASGLRDRQGAIAHVYATARPERVIAANRCSTGNGG